MTAKIGDQPRLMIVSTSDLILKKNTKPVRSIRRPDAFLGVSVLLAIVAMFALMGFYVLKYGYI